jgi:anti-sigma factor ChrR (cupin superfamily)
MRHDELLDLAALDAVGALSRDEQQVLRDGIARADAATRQGIEALYAACADLATVDAEGPGPHVRDRIVAHSLKDAVPPSQPAMPFWFTRAHEGWQKHPLPGVMFKALAVDQARGVATLLLKVGPGAVYPPHDHSGHEECYVIEGDVEVMGQRLGPGDFHHADAGSAHGSLTSEHGATVLLVVALSDYLN